MKTTVKIIILTLLCSLPTYGQEMSPFATYDIPTHNLLKFNRFLINPTFSTVREVKSYFNMQHRNQSISFEDNYRAYFLSYSGRISDRSGIGIGVFNQREGLLDNYGLLGNFAYGIRLSPNSNFTFGSNVIYYNSGVNQNRANTIVADPTFLELNTTSFFSFQPGFNISYKNVDVGLLAENLFDYNLKSKESVTTSEEKIYTAHLQYTKKINNSSWLLDDGRVLSLVKARRFGDGNLIVGGNIIFDLPNAGWLQLGYDDFYGASAGVGFNLKKRVSIGYTVEKGLSPNFENFGINHEISLAYSFTPRLTERMVQRRPKKKKLKPQKDALANNNNSKLSKEAQEELERLKQQIDQNDKILNQLLKDIENAKSLTKNQISRKFDSIATVARTNKLETKQETKPKPAEKKNAFFNTLNIPNVTNGFYLITNVFKSDKYVQRFMDKLKDQGHNPEFFQNNLNGFTYVYLKHYTNIEEASDAFQTNLNGKFEGDMFIIRVQNTKAADNNIMYNNDNIINDGY